MGIVLPADCELDELGFLIQSEEERAFEDLTTCLALSKWNKRQARFILIGCVPEEISPIVGRPALLPGDSPLRGIHNAASFKGHFDMEWDSVEFVDQPASDLTPYGWVKLAEKNNHKAPWMELLAQDAHLQKLLLATRPGGSSVLQKIEMQDAKRDAALSMHALTSPEEAKALILFAWDQKVPSKGPQETTFRDWANENFAPIKSAMVNIKTVRNWISDLTAERDGRRPTSDWMLKVRQLYPLTVPHDFAFPNIPGDAAAKTT